MSDRNTDSVSNRSLLSRATVADCKNTEEVHLLTEYQKILRKEDSINLLDDKKLLRLEATKPLQDIIHREKEKAYKRAEQEGKKALAEYREQVTREQEEILEKWREGREKALQKRKEMLEEQRVQQEQQEEKPSVQVNQAFEEKYNASKKPKKRGGIIALCIILAILVAGLSVALFFSTKDTPSYKITFYKNEGVYFFTSISDGKQVQILRTDDIASSIYMTLEIDSAYVNEPQPPTRSGFVFAGWYQDPECTEEFLFNYYKVNGNINLYAKWIRAK